MSSPWRSAGTCASACPTGMSRNSWRSAVSMSTTSRSIGGSRGSHRRSPRPPGPASTSSVIVGTSTRALLRWPWRHAISKTPFMRSHRYPRTRPAPPSAFAGYRFPPEVITLAIGWYLRFVARAIDRTRISPVEVTTDRYRVYPRVIDELLPAAFHDTEIHANNPIETDHGRLKARLRPMRGLKRDRTARVIVAAHALVQNLRRGFYDLGIEVPAGRRLADAFAELAVVI